MKIPFTRKRLIDWAGAETVRLADKVLEAGDVLKAEYDPPYIKGSVVVGGREMETGLKLVSPTLVDCTCPCYTARERGLICSHGIAVALQLVKRAADPLREAKYRAERRRAARLAAVDDAAYIQRVPSDTPGAVPAQVRLVLPEGWQREVHERKLIVPCDIEIRGRMVPAGDVPTDVALTFSKADENLLYVLEDIAEGPLTSELAVGMADLVNLIGLHRGRSLTTAEGKVQVGTTPMETYLRMDLDGDAGGLILFPHTELPFTENGELPSYFVAGREGWVCGGGHLWPLAKVLPGPYHAIYGVAITVPRDDVLRFLRQELPVLAQSLRVESDLSLDLFSVEPAAPDYRLAVRGSPASLSATLYASYNGLELVANRPDARENFALPDPDDLLAYKVRDREHERGALRVLMATGFRGEVGDDLTPIIDKRNVMNFLGSSLPALRRRGWRVDLEGSVAELLEDLDFVTPVVHIETNGNGEGWFDVGFDYEDPSGASISAADIQLALRKGESFVRSNGRTLLIDGAAIEAMNDVFSDCGGEAGIKPGQFRVDDVYAAYIKSSLDALDGVDVEDTEAWRNRAARANRGARMEPVTLAPPLHDMLRPYQLDGVSWMRFMEESGFCGILADEMGLGKTVQALAWLRMGRFREDLRDKPALVVCPTSLVDNWCEESARFAPELKTIAIQGSDRHALWDQISQADLAVTSYALLRRDAERYREITFAAVILDEAQHIKNRNTQNAHAAKSLQVEHRMVLTGTPMENTVLDLWSIMDFLMPGYLGRHDAFKHTFEQPIARGGDEGDQAQRRLRRKLQPFMLRRLKRDVARDLPPKIERVATCQLSSDQRVVYKELLASSRRKINTLVSQKGFAASRMEILTLLMRLRQACCHLDLLKLPGLTPREPSAKMDQCMELFSEAIDGGHRVLLFSQFVGMLHILRDALAKEGVQYCYLDGSTKERLQVVHRFNTDRSIPVFLISLKAGGTGLNLTGADMVVHYDPWWNPAVEAQATDRAYRIGQKRTVYSVKLITADTVEEKVLALQKKKQAVIDATVERDDAAVTKSLSWEDIQGILDI